MAAWLIAQHTPDKDFLKQCLKLMQENPTEVEPHNLARTIDRVRLAEGKLQYYGTHFGLQPNGRYEVLPIEDTENVEKRRLAMGLPTIAEGTKRANNEQ